MIRYFKKMASLAFAIAIIATSCSESKTTTTEEETKINSMDSTSRVAVKTMEKLEDQTKKVEASLEKLDSEFKANN